jgi:LmbE family N-acetylglucosaminyl deacetylase
MLFESGRRALVVAAHTDDEFACAGTILRMHEAGMEVFLAAFSAAEESVPAGFERDVLKREVRDAIGILGIAEERFRLYAYPVRHFPEHRQEILEQLVALRAEIQPQIVFAPAQADIHQDHGVVAREALRAFKHASLLGYEMPMNLSLGFAGTCFVRLEERHLAGKAEHARAYRSQAARPYMSEEFLRSLAAVRGLQMNQPAAEAFEVIRLGIM